MRIKSLSGTFGKLKNATLAPGSGLTVVSAPNEAGKSTWCALLTAMLYGVDTSERDRAGYLSVKTRYRPWDGGAMVGTLEAEHRGTSVTVQRTGKGTAPMKNVIALRTGTAEFIKGLDGETLGEELTGVTRPVFERTALIRRPDIRVSQTPELESRIAGIVTTGDEETSFTRADEALRRWQRKLRYNKSGEIPALEQELREANRELEQIETSAGEIASLRSSMAKQEKQIELMEQDMEIHRRLEERAAARRLAEAKRNAENTKKRVDELSGALTRDGRVITREDLAAVRESAGAVMPLKKVSADAERALWRAEKDLVDAANRREASPLSGRDENQVAADIARGRELEEKARNHREPKGSKLVPALLCVLAAVGVILTTGLLEPVFRGNEAVLRYVSFDLTGIITSVAILAVGLVLFFVKPPHRATPGEKLAELLDTYGVGSVEKLSALKTAYAALVQDEDRKRAARDAARSAYESAGNAAQEAAARAVEQLQAFMPEVKSGEQLLDALAKAEGQLDELTRARFDAVAAQNVYETLLAETGGAAEPDDSYIPMPLRSREDTAAALERAREQLTEATRAYDLAVGAQRTLPDPAVVEGRIRDLTERLALDNRTYSALTLAIETMRDANTRLLSRFSPEISRRAGELMERLTGGKYDRLLFDKGFEAMARQAGSPEARPALALSEGTEDEIYLCLRLAMCELILGGEDPCPVVLDDALANFDDDRCRAALELLHGMSGERQIILFSCHSREAAWAEEWSDAKVIRMQA